MGIQKREYYEGAALHRLISSGQLAHIIYEEPFFILNNALAVYLKYSTRNRSPWGFTFATEEYNSISSKRKTHELFIGLICGFDGITVISSSELLGISELQSSSNRIACFRGHGKHYRVKGPRGDLGKKVAPSSWDKLLEYSVENK